MFTSIRQTLLYALLAVCALSFTAPAMAREGFGLDGTCATEEEYVPLKRQASISRETTFHYNQAMKYKQHARYELARESLLMALASSGSSQVRDRLQRELQIIDLQIRTLR